MSLLNTEPVAAVEETSTTSNATSMTATAVVSKTNKTKKKKKSAAKAKKPSAPSDSEALDNVLTLLYALRANSKFWVNLRNQTKEGEALHKLLQKQPNYKWRQVGISHYLEARHTDDSRVVAIILPHNPVREYEQKLREYKTEKPVDRKPCYSWSISGRKTDDAQSGTCQKFDDAVLAVMNRQAQFVV
jgi:hypothetical protein